jgi:hypothetical protein
MRSPKPTPFAPRPRTTPVDHTMPARLVAVGALLLQPRDPAGPDRSIENRGPWPIFVVVLPDSAPLDPGARALHELLDKPHQNRILVVDGRYRWSVLDPRRALLKLAIHAHAPAVFDVDIVVPARRLLGVIDALCPGTTFAITTMRRASKFNERIVVRDALHEMVLLVNRPALGTHHDGLAAMSGSTRPRPAEPFSRLNGLVPR